MEKNFRKLLLGLTAAGAAGAGIYYWMKKKNDIESEDDFDDDFDDDDFELDDDLGEVKERGYVHLNPSSAQTSDTSSATEEQPESEASAEAEKPAEPVEPSEAEAPGQPDETTVEEADSEQKIDAPEEAGKPADASEEKNE